MSVQITPRAQERFLVALRSEGLDDHAIRVLAERRAGGRIIYGLDFAAPEERDAQDMEVQADVLRLWLDPMVAELIAGTTIDFVEREDGRSGFKFETPGLHLGWAEPVAGRLQELIDRAINPGIAAHGGSIELLEVRGDTALLKMNGGCQGCGMAAVTLREGIERQVLESIPEIKYIQDVTDHSAGENPYYAGP